MIANSDELMRGSASRVVEQIIDRNLVICKSEVKDCAVLNEEF